MPATMNWLLAALAASLPLARAITPEQMLAAPRRSPAVANPSGEWAVYTSTSYDWEAHEATTQWKLLHVSTGDIVDLPAEWGSFVNEIVWVGETDTSVLYINGTNDDTAGGVTLYTADLAADPIEGTKVASLEAPFAGLKAVRTEGGDINFLVNSLSTKDGKPYNAELVTDAPLGSARLYDNVYVRHWDTWLTNERFAVFSGSLTGGTSLSGELKNLLKDIPAKVTRPESPVQPFGDQGDYDLSPDGKQVVFLTKAPELSKANHTASYIYLVPHDGSSVAQALNGPDSSAPKEAQGASGSPRFSRDGTKVAYFQQDGVSYESDRSKLYIADISQLPANIDPVAENWDSSPYSLQWGHEDKALYAISDYIGSSRLFIIPTDAAANFVPKEVTDNTTVSDYSILPDGSALISSNAIWTSRDFYTIAADGSSKNELFSSAKVDPELAGLTPEDLDSFWYEGVRGDKQQAFIAKPTDFDPSKKYPLAYIIHGGPQGFLGNAWSSRWNLRVWADQGFVVVAPNPTGSTSYGQVLTDAIQGQWGGYPYDDIVNAHTYIRENLEYIDCSNAIEAGASYGGYMTNWIQGHDLGREFKALVTHDGVASSTCDYATEELWFIQQDNNGTIWDNPENYEKWNPMNHAKNFSTPHLVIHNDLDFRLPVSEGIAMFNVLQSLGVPSRFLNFETENHWVLNRENSLIWHKTIFDWIRFYTGQSDALDTSIVVTQ